MGGTIALEGNVTPVAEFNHFACSWSAARIYALTSPNPTSTLPESPTRKWKPYPETLPRRLKLTIFPLDITSRHLLSLAEFEAAARGLVEMGSPLAAWLDGILAQTFRKMKELYLGSDGVGKSHVVDMSLHDPLCVWYVLSLLKGEVWGVEVDRDVRVETSGQWTRGMCVVDRRNKRVEENLVEGVMLGDVGTWLHRGYGNRVRVAVESPEGQDVGFAGAMLRRIFVQE